MIYRCAFTFTTIKQSLKILQLKIPTTQTSIKKQYLVLAKKYHPDSAEHTKNEEQKFIEVSQAYEYLKQLTEQQINSNKDRTKSSEKMDEAEQMKMNVRMTREQKARKQTYEYFRRRHQESVQSEQKTQEVQYRNKSIFKTVPEFFVGLLLVAVIFGQWFYLSFKKQNDNLEKKKGEKKQQGNFEYTFKNISPRKRFVKHQTRQVLNAEEEIM